MRPRVKIYPVSVLELFSHKRAATMSHSGYSQFIGFTENITTHYLCSFIIIHGIRKIQSQGFQITECVPVLLSSLNVPYHHGITRSGSTKRTINLILYDERVEIGFPRMVYFLPDSLTFICPIQQNSKEMADRYINCPTLIFLYYYSFRHLNNSLTLW